MKTEEHIEAIARAAVAGPSDPSITLDFKQAAELLEMFGGEPGLVTLQHGNERSHSGAGLYAWYSDLPEEGAVFLGAEPDDERATTAAPPIVWERADPAKLAVFNPSTKVCTMNCGPHRNDPRDSKERKFLCGDCQMEAPNALGHSRTLLSAAASRLAAVPTTQPAPQPVAREPLPSVEIMRIVMGVEQQHNFLRGTTNWAAAVGRAVERAHGIGGQHG